MIRKRFSITNLPVRKGGIKTESHIYDCRGNPGVERGGRPHVLHRKVPPSNKLLEGTASRIVRVGPKVAMSVSIKA